MPPDARQHLQGSASRSWRITVDAEDRLIYDKPKYPGETEIEVVPRSVAEALAEALATIAVDISKYENDSEGLVWRVKLAHESHLAFLAAYPPEEAER